MTSWHGNTSRITGLLWRKSIGLDHQSWWYVCFDVRLVKLLNKQLRFRWFKTPWLSLNVTVRSKTFSVITFLSSSNPLAFSGLFLKMLHLNWGSLFEHFLMVSYSRFLSFVLFVCLFVCLVWHENICKIWIDNMWLHFINVIFNFIRSCIST